MGRSRQPTDVIKANGRKHLSAAEEAERRAVEVKVAPPDPDKIKAPAWLMKPLRKEFRLLARRLVTAGIYTDLDSDDLGRYVTAHHHYQLATANVEEFLSAGDQENADAWGKIQERHFKQARSCANDMGLTVTSRCRLVVPPSAQQSTEDDNPFLTLITGGKAANG